MPVFRVERNKGYTVISNYHLRDKSLSLKAKGLLSQMLSFPEDWDYTLSGLCCINRESKDAIRTAVNKLERAGYIERCKPGSGESLSETSCGDTAGRGWAYPITMPPKLTSVILLIAEFCPPEEGRAPVFLLCRE